MLCEFRAIKAFTMAAALVAGFAAAPAQAAGEENWKFSGTIEIDSTQLAFIFSGKFGGGVLEYEGKEYKFSTGGLGIGGMGLQGINAVGAVYNLDDISKFEGTYVEGRAGITVIKGAGAMRLSNGHGVIIDLKASTKGAALSLGVDGMVITLKK